MPVISPSQNPYAYLERAHATASPFEFFAQGDSSTSLSEDGDAIDGSGTPDTASAFGADGFGFDDFLDIINPLQHIPLVSTLYRALTGDEIQPGARLIGGGLFGGGIGLASSLINTAVEAESGKDIGAHIMALFESDDVPAATIASTTEAAGDGTPVPADMGAANTDPTQPGPGAAVALAHMPGPLTPVPGSLPGAMAPQVAERSARPAPISASGAVEIPSGDTAPPLYMGLQWRENVPDITENIEKARALTNPDLTENQLREILDSFRLARGRRQQDTAQADRSADTHRDQEL